MKKTLVLASTLLLSAIFISCSDDEKVINESGLPASARNFISTHFSGETVTRVVKDTEGKTEYDVRLSNGFKLEFNASGEWRDIEGYGVEIPLTIQDELPSGIISFIADTHPSQVITKLEIERGNFEIHLMSGLEIKFNAQGEFIRYDD